MEKFDIFQTVGPNDFNIIKKTLKLNRKNINGYRNIYLFNEHNNFKFKNIINVNSSFFPFTFEYVEDRVKNKKRTGWIFQQLVKLYFPYLNNDVRFTLVVDCDVFFIKKTNFFNKSGSPYYTTSEEYHEPYFSHMLKLHPSFQRANNKSGISHHMLFDKNILKEIFSIVEDFHNKPFYDVFLEYLDPNEQSSCADYEIYFHYIMQKYHNQVVVRNLNWSNENCINKSMLSKLDYFSLPYYSKTRPGDFINNLKRGDIHRAYMSLINMYYLNFSNKL